MCSKSQYCSYKKDPRALGTLELLDVFANILVWQKQTGGCYNNKISVKNVDWQNSAFYEYPGHLKDAEFN